MSLFQAHRFLDLGPGASFPSATAPPSSPELSCLAQLKLCPQETPSPPPLRQPLGTSILLSVYELDSSRARPPQVDHTGFSRVWLISLRMVPSGSPMLWRVSGLLPFKGGRHGVVRVCRSSATQSSTGGRSGCSHIAAGRPPALDTGGDGHTRRAACVKPGPGAWVGLTQGPHSPGGAKGALQLLVWKRIQYSINSNTRINCVSCTSTINLLLPHPVCTKAKE